MKWLEGKQYINQSYCCCQLSATLNALIFYGKNPPRPRTSGYKTLAEIANCKNSPPSRMLTVSHRLGIVRTLIPHSVQSIREALTLRNHPVIVDVAASSEYHEDGLHAVLAIRTTPKGVWFANWYPKEPITFVLNSKLEERIEQCREICGDSYLSEQRCIEITLRSKQTVQEPVCESNPRITMFKAAGRRK